jgi:hypothetical protein
VSASARIMEPWVLGGFSPKTEYSQLKDEEGVVVANQRRRVWILRRHRELFELTSFTPSNDETETTFSLVTGSGSSITYSSTGKRWVCQEDELELENILTGHYKQTQIWRWEDEWEDVPAGTFS